MGLRTPCETGGWWCAAVLLVCGWESYPGWARKSWIGWPMAMRLRVRGTEEKTLARETCAALSLRRAPTTPKTAAISSARCYWDFHRGWSQRFLSLRYWRGDTCRV